MNKSIDRDYSMREAAARMRVHVATLYRMLERGELRTYRVGKSRRVSTEELDRIRNGGNTQQNETAETASAAFLR